MARVQINYPDPDPVAAPVPMGTAQVPQAMPTKAQQNKLFGILPFGPVMQKPLYDSMDPAVRRLYGLDQPQAAPAATTGTAPAAGTAQQGYTPVSAYGVNDTGRTTPFAPNPTYTNTTTLPMAGPTYAPGSGSQSMQGGSAPAAATNDPFGGFLGGLIGLLTGKKQTAQDDGQYEAALRERPADIQRLVSMTQATPAQRGQNAGGFLGGLFDDKG